MSAAATDLRSIDPWRAEVLDVVRAMSGGLLLGAPMLYTMEVWRTGSHTDPFQMAVLLAVLLVPVFALMVTAGFRSSRDVRAIDAAADTIEAVAIGMVSTTLVLVMLREISTDTPLAVGLGTMLYESIPFCLGIGVARHFLSGDRMEGDAASEPGDGAASGLHATIADLGAGAVGALFVSLSIAPTDEVPMLSSAMTPLWLLVVVGASLVATYAIVFVAGFSGEASRHGHRGALQSPAAETIAAYLIALLVAVLLLWTFQRDLRPWTELLSQVVVLGFPASIGGAAGRLAV